MYARGISLSLAYRSLTLVRAHLLSFHHRWLIIHVRHIRMCLISWVHRQCLRFRKYYMRYPLLYIGKECEETVNIVVLATLASNFHSRPLYICAHLSDPPISFHPERRHITCHRTPRKPSHSIAPPLVHSPCRWEHSDNHSRYCVRYNRCFSCSRRSSNLHTPKTCSRFPGHGFWSCLVRMGWDWDRWILRSQLRLDTNPQVSGTSKCFCH